MILAAGYGTRLWPLTIDRTKPAIPFLGKPLVGYVAEYLSRYGCREVVVNLHHRPESVREYQAPEGSPNGEAIPDCGSGAHPGGGHRSPIPSLRPGGHVLRAPLGGGVCAAA